MLSSADLNGVCKNGPKLCLSPRITPFILKTYLCKKCKKKPSNFGNKIFFFESRDYSSEF